MTPACDPIVSNLFNWLKADPVYTLIKYKKLPNVALHLPLSVHK